MQKLEYLDLRNLPAYPFVDAAHYLRVPLDTLRSWVRGRHYETNKGQQFSEPLIELPTAEASELSFTNLVEAHVLRAIRVEHKVRLDKIRKALAFIRDELGITHPLARVDFLKTDGKSVYVEHMQSLLDASSGGQIAIRETLEIYLTRVEADEQGIAARLFPFVHSEIDRDERVIVIDPAVSFGRPVIAGTGIPSRILADLHRAGDSIQELAEDYGCAERLVQAAVDYEQRAA
ncbi:MAG: DUF433 domain-containing protein [Cyanobacteria bacterium J06581_3]